MTAKGTILYIPHGGGPLPLMGDPGHTRLNEFLTTIPNTLPALDGVIVISAHWEMDIPVITSHATPGLIYDYYGFPRETYEISYPAPGWPELALRAVDLLAEKKIKARTDTRRGFDHGLFIPLSLMLPQAATPCIQISLCADLSPLAHLELGQALAPLLEDNILLLGSGFSFHNMGAFGRGAPSAPGPDPDRENQAFQDWLDRVCTDESSPGERREKLIRWEMAPGARHCHPREEHLLPLMVCAGAAGCRPAEKVFDDRIMDRRALGLLWRAPEE